MLGTIVVAVVAMLIAVFGSVMLTPRDDPRRPESMASARRARARDRSRADPATAGLSSAGAQAW